MFTRDKKINKIKKKTCFKLIKCIIYYEMGGSLIDIKIYLD